MERERAGDPETPMSTDRAIAQILSRLNIEHAERICERHWSQFKHISRFFLATLFVATPRCRGLTAEVMAVSDDPDVLFSHFRDIWLAADGRSRLTTERLTALEPHLARLREHDLELLWEACGSTVTAQWWRRVHLEKHLADHQRRALGIGDEHLLKELALRAEAGGAGSMQLWLHGFDRRGDPPRRPLEIVRAYLADTGSMSAFEAAARCVAARGKRSDLGILDLLQAPVGHEADLIRADTRFAVFMRTLDA